MNENRVVFDTGVIVSAVLLPTSIPRKAVDLALRQGRLLFAEATLTEVNEVLRRPKFERYISEQQRIEFLLALISRAETISVSRRVRHCRDPKDDKFLEVAVAGHATHIVSGDADLLVLESFEGIPVLSPAEFLASSQVQ
jgi:putative PIN family toxin of toxin-antitoxin system